MKATTQDPLRDTPSFGIAWVAEEEALWGTEAAELIRVSRSAIADRQICEQRRWWGYHAEGTGVAPVVAPTALVVGDLLHAQMAGVFRLAYQAGADAP